MTDKSKQNCGWAIIEGGMKKGEMTVFAAGMPTRYAVGDKVVITAECIETMTRSNRSYVTPNYPSDDFIAKARDCIGVVGEVTHTFPPGYEVSAFFDGQGFHMKDNWIERAP